MTRPRLVSLLALVAGLAVLALILAQADPGPGEKVVVAPIDLAALRRERARRQGHDTRAHLRSSVHGYAAREYLAPAGGDAIAIDALKQRIADAKQKLR